MSPTRFAAAALVAAAATVAHPAAASAPAAGAQAPAHLRQYLPEVRLAGSGRLTWYGLHVYDAALFVAPGFDLANAAALPFALELTYARRLGGKGIAEASRDEIERLGFGSEGQRARWHEQMLKLFPDVEKGRRLAGVNVPGTGARFYYEGRLLGSIDDPAFARAFFAIWLDERTRAPQLRESLLRTLPLRTAGL
ncbi:MAG: chalcone isomerase family protein [Burkholderiaceae bacterium]|jgi:hypothetical protein|nr:chalcone isomerase family protein [Burkholderiaceae bacterium]